MEKKLILTAKEPRLYVKRDEPYHEALARWRVRYSAYRDAYVMAWCQQYPGAWGRAFYGVETRYVLEV